MCDLLSAKEIRKKFREGLGRDVSLQAIHYMADKLGWKQRHIGGKIGYHRTFYTALAQHLTELLACDAKIKAKLPFDDLKKTQKPKKSVKKPKEITWNDGNYFTYNGERDNADYEWEKNENRNMKSKILIEGPQIVNNLELVVKRIREQWSSPDDYWYVKIIQRRKDNENVIDGSGKSIFANKNVTWIDGRYNENKIGYVIVKGNTVEEAIDSLVNPTVTIFDSWVDFVGQKVLKSSDGKMSDIIEVCRMFNARAYISMSKNSFSKVSSREPGTDFMTPKVYQNLRGKTDSSSRERVFDYFSTHKANPHTPYWFIDCDEENKEIQNNILNYLKEKYNIVPTDVYETHNGIHYLIDMSPFSNEKGAIKKITDDINYYFRTIYGNENKKTRDVKATQENPIEMLHGKSILLYSEVGVEGRNVAHPEWQKNTNYPVPEFRSKPKIKEAIRCSIKKFLKEEFNII